MTDVFSREVTTKALAPASAKKWAAAFSSGEATRAQNGQGRGKRRRGHRDGIETVSLKSLSTIQCLVNFWSAALCFSWLCAVFGIAALQFRFTARAPLPFLMVLVVLVVVNVVGFLSNDSLKHLLVPIASVPDQTSTALASFYAPHVGCAEPGPHRLLAAPVYINPRFPFS